MILSFHQVTDYAAKMYPDKSKLKIIRGDKESFSSWNQYELVKQEILKISSSQNMVTPKQSGKPMRKQRVDSGDGFSQFFLGKEKNRCLELHR